MSFSLRIAFILLSIGLSAQRAKALRVSLARELTSFCTELEGASRGISLTELVILFTTGKYHILHWSTIFSRLPPLPPSFSLAATIWLVAGTYVLLLITEGRDSPVVHSLHRTSGHPTIIHLPWSCPTDIRCGSVTQQVTPYPACVISTPIQW